MNHTDRIRAILVDDETEARDVLSTLLKNHPEIELAGMAENARQGLELIICEHPDLVFLDIQMPRQNGFDLVSELKRLNLHPAIIFVTAYDEYAIRAFKISAFDYLLKPVDPDILADTLLRYKAFRNSSDFNSRVDHLLHHLHHDDRLRINTRCGYVMINPGEILYASADGNYTRIYSPAGLMELVTLTLGVFEEILPPGHFMRISRSVIINRDHLYRVDRKNRTCEVIKDGTVVTLKISKSFLGTLTSV